MFRRLTALLRKNRKQPPDPGGMMNVFRVKYANFKALLESNAELLKIISGMEEKLTGQHVFGMSYIRSETARTIFHTARMIGSFEGLSGRKFPELSATLKHIREAIDGELDLKNVVRGIDFVLPYDRIGKDSVDFVGGKNANLGEIKSRVGLPIPKGFAITTTAFDELIEYNDLSDEIRKHKMALDASDPESIMRISQDIQSIFLAAEVPPKVEQAIFDACDRLISPDRSARVSLRSSAIGEDSELSFAGQYQSCLNVSRDDIILKYKEVIASLFTPRAISYRHHMGISFEEAAMSVGCLEMIPAKAGGVIYTRHPFRLMENSLIIHATWGLGALVVDGSVAPDTFEVSKTNPPVLLKSVISHKEKRLVTLPDGNLSETGVDPDLQDAASLSEEQALVLTDYAMKLEAHYQMPQDIEWAIDADGRPVILQTRPLRLEGDKGAFFSTQRFDQLSHSAGEWQRRLPRSGLRAGAHHPFGKRPAVVSGRRRAGGGAFFPPVRPRHGKSTGRGHQFRKHHRPHGLRGTGIQGPHGTEHPKRHHRHRTRHAHHGRCVCRQGLCGKSPRTAGNAVGKRRFHERHPRVSNASKALAVDRPAEPHPPQVPQVHPRKLQDHS